VLSSRERALVREKELYERVLQRIQVELPALQMAAHLLGQLDVYCALANRAHTYGWTRPQFSSQPGLIITQGRHPVIEAVSTSPFVANDLSFSAEESLKLITGPNMGGKSTYMRQTALIILLAHMGSFVPAEQAVFGPIDRIFTRIGAQDDLTAGQSTFMVEMTEAAHILHHATEQSVILLDEIGRGTSTFDGLALAWSIAEHLGTQVGAKTLFATHYFELTELANQHPTMGNLHVAAVEKDHQLIFLHKVLPGPASRSYGIQVAQLAGLPQCVIARAKEKLLVLEKADVNVASQCAQ